MANEFICSDCGGDGTRCDCHKYRKPMPPKKWEILSITEQEYYIRENKKELKILYSKLKSLTNQ